MRNNVFGKLSATIMLLIAGLSFTSCNEFFEWLIDNPSEVTIRLSTDRENQYRCVLGAGNCIIIGTSSYDNMLIAYEGQGPNCLNQYGGTRYPLTWQKGGNQLSCAKCGRYYDVNNGTVASGDGGKQLYRYQAAFDGQFIRAWN